MRHQGTMTKWKDDQGFGFITPLNGGAQVFVHIKSFSNRQRRPIGNEIVSYELVSDAKGRDRAEDVAFLRARPSIAASSRNGLGLLAFPVLFLMCVAASVFAGKLPVAVLGLYLVASAVTYLAYAHDKSAARSNRRRTKENTLHALSLIGGWPGAFVAQKLLRHKSTKESFQNVFWIIVVLNCIGLVLLS